MAPKAKAMSHPAAEYAVKYGGDLYLVDVRYVDIISESVIAIRQGTAGDEISGRPVLEVNPSVRLPSGVPFADDAYRRVAVDIADAVQKQPPICSDGQTMRIATDENDDARTLFRDAREAWVVFALCPEPEAKASG